MPDFTSTELNNVAERLSNYMLTHKDSKDAAKQLTDAIIAIYGSLDTFYTMFFQFLSPKEKQQFAALVEQKMREGQSKTIADVITTSLFQNIIQALKKHKISNVQDANARKGFSPQGKKGGEKGPGKGR